MSKKVALVLNAQYIECLLEDETAPVYFRRQRGQWPTELKTFLNDKQVDGKQIHCIWSADPILLGKGRTFSPAALLTIGFEHWLKVANQMAPAREAFYPRVSFPKDHCFSVDERCGADGIITKEVSQADLDFLISKLELMSVQTVATCFLHSTKNPSNEHAVKRHLNERGFAVVTSAECLDASNTHERMRWASTLGRAIQIDSLLSEFKGYSEVLSVPEPHRPQFANHLLGCETLGRFRSWLDSKAQPVFRLHLGNDQFCYGLKSHLMVESGYLHLQPYSLVEAGLMPYPSASPYQVGPSIASGRGLIPSLLDVLMVALDARIFSDLHGEQQKRIRTQVMESLFSLSNTQSSEKVSPESMLELLVTDFLDELIHFAREKSDGLTIELSGAIGRLIEPLLKKSDSGLNWQLVERPETFECELALEWTQPWTFQ